MYKKLFTLVLCVCLALGLAGCGSGQQNAQEDTGKLQVVTTLFPQYDFARQVAGDLADVTLLLPPGTEAHTYEPSPADIINIQKSDLFIYTGKYMESWAEGIISNLDSAQTQVLDVSEGITLVNEADEPGHSEEDGEAHTHQFDPHIWTSPLNAVIMVDNIRAALAEADPANAQAYEQNAAAYIAELQALDNDFMTLVNDAPHKKIMFGGRFAMYYFAQRYGLSYTSAYDSCSSETEPGARLVAQIVDEMKAEQIDVIYYEELSNHAVADSIAAETGAKALLLHSCHNVTKEELAGWATYLSLMRQNYENLKEGLY